MGNALVYTLRAEAIEIILAVDPAGEVERMTLREDDGEPREFAGDELTSAATAEGIRLTVVLEDGAADGPVVRFSVLLAVVESPQEGPFDVTAASVRTTQRSLFGGPHAGPQQSFDAMTLVGTAGVRADAADGGEDVAAVGYGDGEVPEGEAPAKDEAPAEGEAPAEDEGVDEEALEAEAPAEDEGVDEDLWEAEAPAEDEGDDEDLPEAEAPAEDEGDEEDLPEAEAPAEENLPAAEAPAEDDAPAAEESAPDDADERVAGESRDWYAFYDEESPGPPKLIVTGTCTMPTPGYRIELRPAEPQGINPYDLLLDKIITAPDGAEPDVLTDVEVRYENETEFAYDKITIVPDGPTVAVIYAE